MGMTHMLGANKTLLARCYVTEHLACCTSFSKNQSLVGSLYEVTSQQVIITQELTMRRINQVERLGRLSYSCTVYEYTGLEGTEEWPWTVTQTGRQSTRL